MKTIDNQTHSFLVRIWVEPRLIEGKPPLLRGLVENLSNGEKVYIKDLNEIITYLNRFFENQGIKQSRRSFWRRLKDRS